MLKTLFIFKKKVRVPRFLKQSRYKVRLGLNRFENVEQFEKRFIFKTKVKALTLFFSANMFDFDTKLDWD